MSQESKSPLSSLIPVIILGVASVLLMQYWNPSPSKPKPDGPVNGPAQEGPSAPSTLNDFTSIAKAKDEKPGEIEIDTGHNVYVLNKKGGRIEKIYVKSREAVRVPRKIIDSSEDPLARKYGAVEITMGNGMDFQPHLYYSGEEAAQFGKPSLNDVMFSAEESTPTKGVHEIKFRTNLEFKGRRLELIKIFRFLDQENFFHQVTILRNIEKDPFVLGGDLFFKPFAGVGPAPESDTSRELAYFGRFINYDDSLKRLPAYGAGGSGFMGCGSGDKGPFTRYIEKPDTLAYLGAHSRYFIAYARFFPTENKADAPDGAILSNNPSRQSNAFFTTFFRDFRLDAARNEPLLIEGGPEQGSTKKSHAELVKVDQARGDALIINMQIYAGLRADEEHGFVNAQFAQAEFGEDSPLSGIRDVIYSSTFLALFSKVRDWIVVLMRLIHTYVGNYGLAIILIAVALKLATYPLNQMQAKTMKKMSALKPELDAINTKYADDPNEKQKRTMELYQKHKINPAKGCLPIFIQIPIFIALYSAFTESIELWQSPFFLWIKDLSEPDTVYEINFWLIHVPVNVLPLLMVASQFLQQKLTTVVSDPQQRMLMYVMPFVMIFFFWSMPSGVTLYWTVQNLIAVAWQLAANRFAKVEE